MAYGDFLATMDPPRRPMEAHAPAKINLFLAVTGRRPDGYHDLVSVAATLDWGDRLTLEPSGAGFTLACDAPGVPADGSNLVLRAAERFAREGGEGGGARFTLAKAIPAGAGLGGASSDAVAALKLLNASARHPLGADALARVAAAVGSDCVLFLADGPVVMRGRGERTEPLPAGAAARIRGRRLLVFKPSFSISTPWAYARLAAQAPAGYVAADAAEAALASWVGRPTAPLEELLANSMEAAAFSKYPALPVLLEELRRRFGLGVRMSGSGSACFALLPEGLDAAPVAEAVRWAWGESAFVREGRIA